MDHQAGLCNLNFFSNVVSAKPVKLIVSKGFRKILLECCGGGGREGGGRRFADSRKETGGVLKVSDEEMG